MATRNEEIIESKLNSSLNHQKSRFNPEGYTIIWVDPDVISTSEYVQLQNKLSQIINFSFILDNVDACKAFITENLKNNTIFIVVSKLFANVLLSYVNNLSQVESVFILCEEGTTYTFEDQSNSKQQKVFDNKHALLNQLELDINQHSHQWNMSLVEQSFTEMSRVQCLTDEKRTNQVCFTLLTQLPYDDEEMKAMITKSRHLFQDNNEILKTINTFEHEYSPSLIIYYDVKRESLIMERYEVFKFKSRNKYLTQKYSYGN